LWPPGLPPGTSKGFDGHTIDHDVVRVAIGSLTVLVVAHDHVRLGFPHDLEKPACRLVERSIHESRRIVVGFAAAHP
jgi:hypothetical protein